MKLDDSDIDMMKKRAEDIDFESFWLDCDVLTNKFEPFDTFNLDTTMFELDKETV
jgi:hypothetical protein